MFFVHELPEITDSFQFVAYQNKEGLTQDDIQFLKQADQLRKDFKSILNQENLKIIVQNRVQLNQKKEVLENYLKINVDMMRILLVKLKEHPKFSYKLTISKKQQQYKTEKINTIQETCGCEIVICRMMYLLGFNNSAVPHILRLRYSMIQTPNNIDQADIEEGLNILSIGWKPYNKLYNVMDDLLYFLVQKQQNLIPELKMALIFSLKLIIECNMNFLYLELLRKQKNYESMIKVCKSSYTKLIDAFNRLNQIKDDIQPQLIEFCISGQRYFQTYGIWSILLQNENNILLDRTRVKSYSVQTAECHKIALKIVQTSQELSQIKQLSEYDSFTLGFIQTNIMKTLEKSLSVYSSSNQQPCQLPDQLLISAESQDYTDLIKKE